MSDQQDYSGRITIDPTICFGKPIINGTRIPVFMIIELIEQDVNPNDIITQCYPDITLEDIKACLHYAAGILKNEEVSYAEAG